MRVAVVGCGVVGAAVARELQLHGADTVVFEAARPGAGTSGTTFAWVNSFDKYEEITMKIIRLYGVLIIVLLSLGSVLVFAQDDGGGAGRFYSAAMVSATQWTCQPFSIG